MTNYLVNSSTLEKARQLANHESASTTKLYNRCDGGLKTASVLLSVCASASRHRLNPWSYLRDALDQLAVRSAGADLSDLPPEGSVQARSRLAA